MSFASVTALSVSSSDYLVELLRLIVSGASCCAFSPLALLLTRSESHREVLRIYQPEGHPASLSVSLVVVPLRLALAPATAFKLPCQPQLVFSYRFSFHSQFSSLT